MLHFSLALAISIACVNFLSGLDSFFNIFNFIKVFPKIAIGVAYVGKFSMPIN